MLFSPPPQSNNINRAPAPTQGASSSKPPVTIKPVNFLQTNAGKKVASTLAKFGPAPLTKFMDPGSPVDTAGIRD